MNPPITRPAPRCWNRVRADRYSKDSKAKRPCDTKMEAVYSAAQDLLLWRCPSCAAHTAQPRMNRHR